MQGHLLKLAPALKPVEEARDRMEQSDPELVASMFWSIAAGADDAFVVANDDQKIVVFNEAAQVLFGHSAEDVLDKPLSVLLPKSAAPHHDQMVRTFEQKDTTWRSMSRRPSVEALRADGSKFQAAITILKTTTAGSTLFGAIVRDVSGHERADALLNGALTATAGVTGQEFFEKAVEVLAVTLNVHTAFIALPVASQPGFNRMTAKWSGGMLRAPTEYEIATTPCSLALTQDVVHYPIGLRELFPKLFLASAVPAVGFFSLRLAANTGEFLGHIGLLNSAELHLTSRELSSLRVFGSRIAAELDRVRINSEIASESDFRDRISQTAPFGVTYRNVVTGEAWSNDAFRAIVGRSYLECRQIGWDQVLHPDDLGKYLAESELVRESGGPLESSFRVIRPNGEIRWLLRYAAARLDAHDDAIEVSTTVVDMTATHQAIEESQAKSNELDLRNAELQGILSAFPDAHFRVAADGTYLSVEVSDRTEFGVPIHELVGAKLSDFMSKADAESTMAAIGHSLRTGEVSSAEYSWESESGIRHYEARYAPIGDDEVIAVARDIGNLRALEAQVVHASTMQSVGLLAGGLAHDFNNVLHVIGGHASALQRDTSDSNITRRRIGAIRRAVDRTSSLIERLMTVSRPAPNNPSPNLLDELLLSLRPSLEQMLGASIALDFDLNAPKARVLIDDTRLESALLNLASNASDAMADGGTLKISTCVATVGTVELRVSDNGSGMDAETAENAFTPFFTTKSVGVGTGLGLATTYSTIVSAHGNISVESTSELGSVFKIELPITTVQLAPAEDQSREPPIFTESDTIILVVEDEADVLELCSDTLQSLGYQVRQADSGEVALALLESGERIDGVLTDVAMPGMSGPELASRIGELSPDVPVFFMSGYSPSSVGSSIPSERLLRKPFSDASLEQLLREHL